MNQPYPSRMNMGMNIKGNQEKLAVTGLSYKYAQENLIKAADNWHPFAKNKYKSAKKL